MKKALSVFLSILMLFAALSVGTSAADSPFHGKITDLTDEQTILGFNLNGGSLENGAYVYDDEIGFTYKEGSDITGTYYMIPRTSSAQTEGSVVILPDVTPSSGNKFTGWYCSLDGITYGAESSYVIPEGTGGTMIVFTAAYKPSEAEEDTLANVLNILIKVFGTILGIIMYSGDTSKGIALMNKIVSGITES